MTGDRLVTVGFSRTNAPPVAAFTVSTTTPLVGQIVTFNASTSTDDVGITNYVWDFNADGLTDATGVTASFAYPNPVIYTAHLRVFDTDGAVDEATRTITVSPAAPLPPVITQQPQNATVGVGQSATFTVVASSTVPLTYEWSRNGVVISGATSASYSTPAAVLGDDGSSYRVIVTNSSGSVTSNSATLTCTQGTAPANDHRLHAGSDYSVAVSASGTVYSWGSDDAGTLGDGGGSVDRNVPGTVPTITDARYLGGRGSTSYVTRANGQVWGWGYNGFGQLGNRNTSSAPAPVRMQGSANFTGLVAVAGGTLHSLALRPDGIVEASGIECQRSVG